MKSYFMFQCPKCKAQEVYDKREIPCGDVSKVDQSCDHCNTTLQYVGMIGGNTLINTTPMKTD